MPKFLPLQQSNTFLLGTFVVENCFIKCEAPTDQTPMPRVLDGYLSAKRKTLNVDEQIGIVEISIVQRVS